MDVKDLADLKPSNILEVSNDPKKLSFTLQKILGTREQFANQGMVPGGMGSVRIFYANPNENGIPLSAHDGHPATIAESLMRSIGFGEIRHPEQPRGKYKKGWALRSVIVDGRHAAIAEAAWI